jgi:hypothetical protein
MKLAIVVIACSVSVAHATTFDEYTHGTEPRPAEQLYEAACDLDVDLRGAIATVDMRQRIVNPGPQAMAAIYEFELPSGAVVTGMTANGEKALAVPASFKSAEADSSDVLGADPAVLRRTAEGHEIMLQPIAPDHEVVLSTRYAALAVPRANAFRLVLPGRTARGKIASCKGTVRVTPGPGTTVQRIRIGGVAAGTRATAPFVVNTKDVTIDIDLEVAGSVPVVWSQTQALADGWSASLLTVLAPRVKAAGARRVVFLVDGSRSMDLVGRHNVGKVVHALGSALPAGAEVEAIIYDRTATRVFGDIRPATAQNLSLIESTIAKRGSANGSDLVKAFELTKQVISAPGGGARGQAMVIVITDGVTPELDDNALIRALDAKTSLVDVHAIVLDPAHTRSPGAKVLRAPVNLYGGAYVEVSVDELDDAMIAIDGWMRPSWLELALDGQTIPPEVRAGTGFTHLMFHKGARPFTLTGHSDAKINVAARSGPTAPIAELALATANAALLSGVKDPNDAEVAAGAKVLEHSLAAHPVADRDHAFAVLSTIGRIAKSRHAMIAGGGRYERMIAIADPQHLAPLPTGPAPIPASSIARITLERLFRDQLQPKAYACYQRALGTNPRLVGTVHFSLRLGRGEITEVGLTGIGDKGLETCLVDAAYAMTPPLPDFTVNADDQTLANYPLTFNRSDDRPVIVLGDADSVSPLDIDAIAGGVPGRKTIKVNSKTPLGNMRPPPP